MWFVGHHCQLDCIEQLVSANAELNVANEEGQTALDLATSGRSEPAVRALLTSKGARHSEAFLARGDAGREL